MQTGVSNIKITNYVGKNYHFTAGIMFLANNMTLFEEYLLKDYRYWHENMLKWLQAGIEEIKSAVIFLNSFLKTLGLTLEITHEYECSRIILVSIR